MPTTPDHVTIIPLAVGRGGVGQKTREGDGITPLGEFSITTIMYRPDRVAPPQTRLPLHAIGPTDIWVDDPTSPDYNQFRQATTYPFSHEKLWRDDGVYDLLAVVDYNMAPIVAGRGSAIFIHLAQAVTDKNNGGGFAPTAGCIASPPTAGCIAPPPTAGCIAIDAPQFYRLAAVATAHSKLHITPNSIYLTHPAPPLS